MTLPVKYSPLVTARTFATELKILQTEYTVELIDGNLHLCWLQVI